MQTITKPFPLTKEGLQKLTKPSLTTFADVTAAQAGIPEGESSVCYIESKQAFYRYNASTTIPADGDLVLTTGTGGNTRWEIAQKVSRTQGDTGWVGLGGAILTELSTTTARLALSSVGTIAIRSVRTALPIGNYDCVLSGVAGLKYIYFDDATGILKFDGTLFDFNTQVPVAIADWSGTAITSLQTEFHGIRDSVWHLWAHQFLGTQYLSGLAITTVTPTDSSTDPNNDNVQYLWLTSGVLYDEDAKVDIGTGNWAQTLGSGLTSADAAIIQFQYWDGSKLLNIAAMSDRTPFIHAGSGTTPQWNNAGTLQAASNNTYVVYHYFGSPRVGGKALFARPHNAIFTAGGQFAQALAARPSSLTWPDYAELKHLYSVVFRVNTGWGAAPNHLCKIAAVQDFRLTAGTPTAAVNPTAHSALSGLSGTDVHPDTSITNTTDTGGLDSATETNLGLAMARLANFGYIATWTGGTAYRIGNIVQLGGGIWQCLTANSDATFVVANWSQISPMTTSNAGTAAGIKGDDAYDRLLFVKSTRSFYIYQSSNGETADGIYRINTADGGNSRWVLCEALAGRETAVTITAGDAIDVSGAYGIERNYAVIGNAAGQNALNVVPFGASAPSVPLEVTLIGRSDTNTVTLATNDVAKGALLAGGFVELALGTSIRFRYSPTLDRWIEIGRNNY